MRQINIERAVLIGGEHTPVRSKLAVPDDIDVDTADRLIREGVASNVTEKAPKPKPEAKVEPPAA